MKNILLLSFFLLQLAFMISCSKELPPNNIKIVHNGSKVGLWHNETLKTRNVHLEFTLGSESDSNYCFANPTGLAISDGKIYVCDQGDNCIKVFDYDGKFLFTIGRKGNGPGEFNYPQNIALHPQNGDLYVSNWGNMKIQRFNNLGIYKSSFHLNHSQMGMAVNSLGEVIFSKGPIGPFHDDKGMNALRAPEYLICKYDENGNLIMEFAPPLEHHKDPTQKAVLNYGKVCIDQFNNIYFVFNNIYKIRKYDPYNNLVMEFDRKPPFERKIDIYRDQETLQVRGYSMIMDATIDQKSVLWILFSPHPANKRITIDRFYAENGKYLDTIQLPLLDFKPHFISIDEYGRIYILDVSDAKVYRFSSPGWGTL